MTTLTIMRILPREVDPSVYNMIAEGEGAKVTFSSVGGLSEQIRELREVLLILIIFREGLNRFSAGDRTSFDES